MLLVVHDDEFFTRSKHEAIWGTVYFQIGDHQFFPGQGWTDLVVAFVGVWIEGLIRVADGSSTEERIPFFDGPFAVDVSAAQKGFVDLSFLRDEKLVISKKVETRHLLAHGRSVARDLLSLCQQRGWSNKDSENLARLVESMRY